MTKYKTNIMADLKNRNFLKLLDFTPEEVNYLIQLSSELKAAKKEGRETQKLLGKNIALIFEKSSTRTRCRPGLRAAAGPTPPTEIEGNPARPETLAASPDRPKAGRVRRVRVGFEAETV